MTISEQLALAAIFYFRQVFLGNDFLVDLDLDIQ